MAALREETRLVATAQPGTRNDTLNRAAFSLGQLVAAGCFRRWPLSPRWPTPQSAPVSRSRRLGERSARA